MYIVDFEYDGKVLSDYHGILCNFSSTSNDERSFGVDLTWNTVNVNNRFEKTSSTYDTAYQATLEFIKNNCEDFNDWKFSEEEIQFFQRWLRQEKYRKFKPIFNDGSYEDVYFNATFTTINPIVVSGDVIGFSLTILTDSPYGFREEVAVENDDECTVLYESDDYGYIYPVVSIKCYEDGNLELSNSMLSSNEKTIVNNVSVGETISFSGHTKQITSEVLSGTPSHEKIYNDFNYKYPKLVRENINGVDSTTNIFTTNLNATITVQYSPITRVGII